ncbi:MAG: hypothetical protein WAQ27_04195 [Candidatus Microsaccharimonas sp.]
MSTENPFEKPSEATVTAINGAYINNVLNGTSDEKIFRLPLVELMNTSDTFGSQKADNAMEFIEDPETRKAFRTGFEFAEDFFRLEQTDQPFIEAFIKANFDFKDLTEKYDSMVKEGLKPSIVVSPVNLSVYEWLDLFRNTPTNNTASPLTANITDGIREIWDSFTQIPSDGLGLHPIDSITLPTAGINMRATTTWTIRAIAAIEDTPRKGIGYQDVIPNSHPTIAEYLALQARLYTENRKPLDTSSGSWLATNSHNNDPALSFPVPIGIWDENVNATGARGMVTIGRRSSSQSADFLGWREAF